MRFLIYNDYDAHYEILESCMLNFEYFFKKKIPLKKHIACYQNDSFTKYINEKYPDVEFVNVKNVNFAEYDFVLCTTIYPHTRGVVSNPKLNVRYVSHRVDAKFLKNECVFYLSELASSNVFNSTVLPFANEKKETEIPVYVIQGNLCEKRRNYNLLLKILTTHFDHKFEIRMLGSGKPPKILRAHENKIRFDTNLNFEDYHKYFSDVYCILPLITKKSHIQYYTTTLTSTVNYIRGYKLNCIIDRDFNAIYKFDKNKTYVFDGDDIVDAFRKSLEMFYKKKNKTY